MVDDGLSRREVLKRMDELKLRVEDVKALVLTHEHSDHIKGLAVWCKNWSGSMFCSPQTRCAKPELKELPFTPVEPGCAVNAAGMRIDTFSTSHDVAGPMGFRFSYQDDSIGYITDTGIITEGAKATLPDARILAIESNHDVPMLRCTFPTNRPPMPFPPWLVSTRSMSSPCISRRKTIAPVSLCGHLQNRSEQPSITSLDLLQRSPAQQGRQFTFAQRVKTAPSVFGSMPCANKKGPTPKSRTPNAPGRRMFFAVVS